MELWKRSGQGRLAEVLGPAAVARDINARRLRYRGDLKAEFASYAPDTQQILEAFTSGINAYIDAIQRPGARGLPIEFQIAGFKPEHWKPEDCLNRLAAYSMTGNAESELQHAEVLVLVGAQTASELFRFDPAVTLDPAPGIDFTHLSPQLLENVVSSDRRIQFPRAPLHESNNWTLSGALTASGKPFSEAGTTGYLGSLALDRARNWQEFEKAMPRWKVPSENIVYADRDGNIGEHSTGLAPLRKNWTGLLPVPGNGGYEWSGFIANAELPHSYHPPAGFVTTANQKMIPNDYQYAVGFE